MNEIKNNNTWVEEYWKWLKINWNNIIWGREEWKKEKQKESRWIQLS